MGDVALQLYCCPGPRNPLFCHYKHLNLEYPTLESSCLGSNPSLTISLCDYGQVTFPL